jgi:hypothetical protein
VYKKVKTEIYRTIILCVALYGCQSWPLALSEESRVRVFGKRVRIRIFQEKRDGAIRGWMKLHNEGLHNLYSSPNIIRMIKSKKGRWAGNVVCMGAKREEYRILVGKPEERDHKEFLDVGGRLSK